MFGDRDEVIDVKTSGTKITTHHIGNFVDAIFDNETKHVEYYQNKDKTEVCVPKRQYRIKSLGKNGKESWRKIVAVSRHEESRNLYKITLASGNSVRVTEDHSMLRIENGR